MRRTVSASEDSFEAFVVSRTPALLRTAYLLTGDQASAEDLVQSALVKVAPRWDHICAVGPPEAYVRTVLYREHVNVWRRYGSHEVIGIDDAPSNSADPTAAIAMRLTLVEALQQLGRRQRAVIVLRYFDDLSESAVADALGCSVGTVRSQTAKALARLRTFVPTMLEEVPSS